MIENSEKAIEDTKNGTYHITMYITSFLFMFWAAEHEQLFSFGLKGLMNTGCSCYFNCIIQVLLHYEPFKKRLFSSIDWPHEENKLFRNCLLNMEFSGETVMPRDLINQYVQQDQRRRDQDFFEYSDRIIKSFPDQIQKLFVMEMVDVQRNENGDKINEKIHPYTSLICSINSVQLDMFLLDLITEERFHMENGVVTKQTFFNTPPPILTFQIQRVTSNSSGKEFLPYHFSQKLDINHCLVDPSDTPVMYQLFALIIHNGATINYGHYIVYIYNQNDDQYYYFNDSMVRRASKDEVKEFATSTIDLSVSCGVIYIRENLTTDYSIPSSEFYDILFAYFGELCEEEEEEEEEEEKEINQQQLDQEKHENENLNHVEIDSQFTADATTIAAVNHILKCAKSSHGQIDLLSSKDLNALHSYINNSPQIRNLVTKAINVTPSGVLQVPSFSQQKSQGVTLPKHKAQ